MASDKPTIGLNLDTLERENIPEPYRFTLGGKVFTCEDPALIDWRDLEKLDTANISAVLGMFLGDRLDDFKAQSLPTWKVNRLATAMTEHYGLGN